MNKIERRKKKLTSKNVYGPPSSLSGPIHAFIMRVHFKILVGETIIYVEVVHLIDINTPVYRY